MIETDELKAYVKAMRSSCSGLDKARIRATLTEAVKQGATTWKELGIAEAEMAELVRLDLVKNLIPQISDSLRTPCRGTRLIAQQVFFLIMEGIATIEEFALSEDEFATIKKLAA